MPKCVCKQGFVNSAKRNYCELMISCEDRVVLEWLEKLEERIHELVFDRRKAWFHEDIDADDIDNIFTSPVRSYKSGKFFLLRTMLQSPRMLQSDQVNIFDENETQLTQDDITPDTEFISILHFHGIKFSSKNFQIHIEMKQMMVIKSERAFTKCLIKSNEITTPKVVTSVSKDTEPPSNTLITPPVGMLSNKQPELNPINADKKEINNSTEVYDLKEHLANIELNDTLPSELEEIVNTPVSSGTIQLKNKQDVYMQEYLHAKAKAKRARIVALKALIKAKNLKDKYLIENLEMSDEDDTSIDSNDLESITDTLESFSEDDSD